MYTELSRDRQGASLHLKKNMQITNKNDLEPCHL
jgi:hypothetical protein